MLFIEDALGETMSRFLIKTVWHLRISLTQGVGQFNKNDLERWSTVVCYKLTSYKLNKLLESNIGTYYNYLLNWFELHHLFIYIPFTLKD